MRAPSGLAVPNPFEQLDINFSSSGDNIIVPSLAGAKVRVYRMKILVAGATSISIKSGAGLVLDGPLSFAANQGMILDFTGIEMPPWYETATGSALIINSSSGVQVGGNLDYIQSP
jgi:hypothetical protein